MRSPVYLPPSSLRASASSRGAVKPHGRGPPFACSQARRSLHDRTRAGEGRLGTEETRPNPIPLRLTPAPRPRTPAPLTGVGFDVLPQEVAAGEMLEAKALSDPLAHGALARARRPKDDRAQEFGSHCLRQAGRGRPNRQPGQQPRRSPGNFVAAASASDTLRSRGDSPGAPAGGRSDF